MKKFIVAILASVVFTAGASAQEMYGPTLESAQPTPQELKQEFSTLTQTVMENAAYIREHGPRWAVKSAEIRRLQLMLDEKKVEAQALESEINKIVQQQTLLSMRGNEINAILSTELPAEEYITFQRNVIIPSAIEMQTMRDLAIGFVTNLESGSARFEQDKNLRTADSHAALTRYDQKMLNDYLSRFSE